MAHFLSEILLIEGSFALQIERTGTLLASAVVIAGDSEARRQGLLGRDALPPGSGLVIAPSQGVHTFGMRFPLDIIGVTRDGTVVKCRSNVPPRRVVMAWSAFAIVELGAGELARAGLSVGDRLVALTL